MNKLKNAHVAVFGLGGVGGYVVEALVRSGVGQLTLVDHDKISLSNINRQILATVETVGMEKAQAAKLRVKAINPGCEVTAICDFFGPNTRHLFDFTKYDYVVDAIDTVTGKLSLVEACKEAGTPILCSMGAGNKLDPSAFRVADLSKTQVCPLAKIMRRELGARGIKHLTVVYSEEKPQPSRLPAEHGKHTPASLSFVPPAMGLIMAGKIVRDLACIDEI